MIELVSNRILRGKDYPGFKLPETFRITVYVSCWPSPKKGVVIFAGRPCNQGPSVTNSIEALVGWFNNTVALIRNEDKIPAKGILWRFVETSEEGPGIYDQVTISDQGKPEWQYIGNQQKLVEFVNLFESQEAENVKREVKAEFEPDICSRD